MLFKVYDDQKAFEAHQAGAAFEKYLADGGALVAWRERQVWTRLVAVAPRLAAPRRRTRDPKRRWPRHNDADGPRARIAADAGRRP